MVYPVATVYTVYTIQTALHCLNISKYAYYCLYILYERLGRYCNGLMKNEQKVGVDVWVTGVDTH